MSARGPRDELREATPHGELYLRRLVRAQLGLSLSALVAFGGLIGSLPLALVLLPALGEVSLLGIPLSILLLVVPPFPLFVVLGWLYARRAARLEADFRALVEPDR